MEIELKKIPVRDLCKDYEDDAEGGVLGYGGKLDIRPPYQREFVYNATELMLCSNHLDSMSVELIKLPCCRQSGGSGNCFVDLQESLA